MNNNYLKFLLKIVLVSIISCTQSGNDVTGGSTDTGNNIVVGTVVDISGNKVENAIVYLIPQAYNPIFDKSTILQIDTTGKDGTYSFDYNKSDSFNVQIENISNSTSRLAPLNNYSGYLSDTVYVIDTLKETGSIQINFYTISDTLNSFAFIKGSTFKVDFANTIWNESGPNSLLFNGVPSEVWMDIYLVMGSMENEISENVWVSPKDTSFILYGGEK